MAEYSHQFQFAPIPRPVRDRKKVPRVPPRIVRHRNPHRHAQELIEQAEKALEQYQRATTPEGTTPKQILSVDTARRVSDENLARNNMLVLDSSRRDRVVALARDPALSRLRDRAAEYGEAPSLPDRPPDWDTSTSDEGPRAKHEQVFDAIDGFHRLEASERISRRLESKLESAGSDETIDLLVDLYSPSDTELREIWMDEVVRVAQSHEVKELHAYDDPAVGITIFRLAASPALIRDLSELDQVAELDAPEPPALTRPGLAELQDLETLEAVISGPDGDVPAVGLVDSGIRVGHPMIEPASLGADALHPVFQGRGEDGFGHGTLVAGLALYWDVLQCAHDGDFVASFPLASVRIFDDDGRVPAGVNPATLIRDAIEHLVDRYDCRVICVSLGDHNDPFIPGSKASALAALIDDAARALDVVVIVPTGNIDHATLSAPAALLRRYPAYLQDPGNELLSPSQAALAITVGAIADRDVSDVSDPAAAAGATAGGPAPYARRGPGVRASLKPELVEDGGNWIFDRGSGDILNDTGTAVVSLSARQELLFDTAIGSSFAAGRVANVAGRVAARYPDLSSAAIRALLLQGSIRAQAPQHFDINAARNLLGHGRLDPQRCLSSTDDRTVLLSEQSLRSDGFHVYRLPATNDFFMAPGTRHLTVSLAFDPPVRYRRFDYMAFQMECVVVRGISEDEVFHLASSDNAGKLSELSKAQFKLDPPTGMNGRGANQLGRVTLRRRPQSKFQQDWYIVVRSVNKWMRDRSPQPYALAVALEVEGSAQLHQQLETALRLQPRLRVRA